MIIAERFLWLHLPKTGGTSMNRLFREWAIPGISIDPDGERAKHDSIALREARGDWRAGSRRRFITIRRLDSWLLSDWRHKRRHLSLPELAFEPVQQGLFYSLRLGGVWVAADWWLRYFELDEQVTSLRLEHIADDLNRHLLPLLPAGTPLLQAETLPQENAAPPSGATTSSGLEPISTAGLYAVNPLWAAWEERVYGTRPACSALLQQPSP